MSKKFILGFSRVNATLVVGDEAAREATVSPYNYQDTPKSICKALVAGKGITSVSIVVDGTERFGGVCIGRTVGPDRSAVPGAPAKINLFWVTPQAAPTDPRNTFIGLDGAIVHHRTDWVPISRHELLALQAGAKFVLASVVAPKPTPVAETHPVIAPEEAPKGKRAQRAPASA
jgi:hypothetical protein